MSHLAQAPDGEAVAVAAPPWFPDQDDIDLLWHIGLFRRTTRARCARSGGF